MRKINRTSLMSLGGSVSAFALLIGTPAFAQTADEDDQADGVSTNDPGDDDISDDAIGATGQADEDGLIVVTGSRVKRDTYSSISPLQVIDNQTQQDIGTFNAADILQRSEAAAGTQIDATFSGFVLNNGPGSSTFNLRGLGADRTLLLVNGRRLAPAGVEGAPSSPSLNLLPTSLIARYDLLLDGASSVYGSDAVAGVGNVILRSDFDGLELFASGVKNEQSNGGDDYTVSAAWGTVFDRGFIGIGAEYARTDRIRFSDRDFFSGCATNYEETTTGEIRTVNIAENANVLANSGGTVRTAENPCVLDRITGRISIVGTRVGSVYYDTNTYPTTTVPGNTGIPFFSETTDAFGVPVDRDGDGVQDINLFNRTINGNDLTQEFSPQQDSYNVMAYGEYELGGAMNITPFFEALYSRADVDSDNSGVPQFFPIVPGNNQFNPCNISSRNGVRINPDGVDCRDRDNVFNGLVPGSPFYGARLGTGTSQAVQVIPSIRGDRNNYQVTLEQYRGVLGIRGDLPFIDDTWTFEASGVYSRSEGASIRRGIRQDRVLFSLGIDPTADFDGDGVADNNGDGVADDFFSQVSGNPLLAGGSCDASSLANPNLAGSDLVEGCVPVNFFAPSLYSSGSIGDFATQAERDYLFGERTFDTTYEQILVSAFATGDLFTLPAGPVALVVGAEYRKDRIASTPNDVANNGLFFGFFSDGGAAGDKYLLEGFAELDVPVFDDDFWGRLDLNASGRITDEEFYGTAGTYSIKGGWRPVPQVLVKASYGTSFRAPNLRENFLRAQSGFNTLFDPCAVPDDAFDSLGGGYDPTDDDRDPAILDNCRREGRDPTTVGLTPGAVSPFQTSSVEVSSGGSLELDPETSTSFTTGVAVTDSFGAFDYAVNFNYYSIEITDSVVEPSAQFIVNDCFNRTEGTRSPFCDRISYDTSAGGDGLISDVFAGFLNLETDKVKGIDINANLGYDLPIGNEILDLGLAFNANHLIERSNVFVDDNGEASESFFEGEFGFPNWTGRATFTAGYSDFTFTYQVRYVGSMEQDASSIEDFSDAFGYGPDGEFVGITGHTCLGGGSRDDNGVQDGIVEGDGVYCRDVGFVEDYFVHTASIRYDLNDFATLRLGVSNIFDTAPPLVDPSEVTSSSNVPIGQAYDYDGRSFFGSVRLRF
ncbi:TonB-dependent receptor [Citromicrobium bathyomarinum]|uniref:TonB-dependent receptor domain-containing protein n=1 Tax=Citromicrobium bathyomarinum TaxID=72174 RepID=UPI00315A71DD